MRAINIRVPEEVYETLKILTILHKKTMREIVIEAIESLSLLPKEKAEMKKLKHKIYRLKYDAEDK